MVNHAIDIAIFKEGEQWIAHGMNIDYVAAGATEDEARLNFWHGLAQTFFVNHEKLGHVRNVVRKPPQEIMDGLDKRIRAAGGFTVSMKFGDPAG